MTTDLVEAIEAMNATHAPTFPELLEQLWQMRFDGQVVLQFNGGRPLAVVFSEPRRMALGTKSS